MGIYTESIIEREKLNKQTIQKADKSVLSDTNVNAMDKLEMVNQALSFILKSYGKEPVSYDDSCKTVSEILENSLDANDVMYHHIEMGNKKWKYKNNFILAFNEKDAPIVVYPSIIGFKYYDIETGEKGTFKDNLNLAPIAISVQRPFLSNEFSMKEFILQMLKNVKVIDIAAIVVFSLIVAVCGMIVPQVNKILLGSLKENGKTVFNVAWLLQLLMIYMSAAIIKIACNIAKNFCVNSSKVRISNQIQAIMLSKLLMMSYENFVTSSVGKMSTQLKNVKTLSGQLIDFFLNNIISVVISLIYIFQMKSLAPQLLLPAILVLLIQSLLSVTFSFVSEKNTMKILVSTQEMNSKIFETISGIQKIRGAGVTSLAYGSLIEKYRNLIKVSQNPPFIVKLNSTIINSVSSLGAVIILCAAAFYDVPKADYIAFVASFGLISTSVNSLISMVKGLNIIRPVVCQLQELFSHSDDERKPQEIVKRISGDITIEDISFAYGEAQKGCIENLSLSIKPREKVAIVGESGCGKSTLIKLLLGVLTPQKGSIVYDGKLLSNLNGRSLRRKVATVMQSGVLFSGTIFDNIAANTPGLTEEQAWEAARMAAIDNLIKELPLGMYTEISEGNGGGFSGGQRQRIILARAFAQKARIMILDEATSALDNISQKQVLDNVYSLKCTVIMVAHRLSTVKQCDRILLFKEGRIVEEGNYDELIEKNGAFAALVRKQLLEEK